MARLAKAKMLAHLTKVQTPEGSVHAAESESEKSHKSQEVIEEKKTEEIIKGKESKP